MKKFLLGLVLFLASSSSILILGLDDPCKEAVSAPLDERESYQRLCKGRCRASGSVSSPACLSYYKGAAPTCVDNCYIPCYSQFKGPDFTACFDSCISKC